MCVHVCVLCVYVRVLCVRLRVRVHVRVRVRVHYTGAYLRTYLLAYPACPADRRHCLPRARRAAPAEGCLYYETSIGKIGKRV